jgi:tetratricopeptide (TPR) repeat protein
LYSRGVVDILMRGERALSLGIFRISVGFVVFALILLAGALYLSERYLNEQRRLAAAGDMQGAMENVRMAARLDPFGPEPLEAKSVLLQQQGRYEEAAEALREAIRRDPANYSNYVSLANLQMGQLGDLDAAVENYRAALERNPNSAVVASGLAQALLRAGDLEGARRQYERLREAGRIKFRGMYDLGRIYVRTGEPEKGVETLRTAKKMAISGLGNLDEPQRAQRMSLIESIDLAIADAMVVQGRYAEAREIVAGSGAEQAPAIMSLLEIDPEGYRRSVLDDAIY